MTAAAEHGAARLPAPARMAGLLGVGLAAVAAGLFALPVLALADYPAALALVVPVAVAGAAVLLWNTDTGLCFAAFAIGPLGVVQREVGPVTFNLPEVLFLMLALKELVRFVARRERVAPFLPAWTLSLLLVTSGLGVAVGLWRGNGAAAVLQDFRQYTEYIVLYLLVVHRVRTRRQMVRLLTAFLLGMALLAVHGILQRFTGLGVAAAQVLSDLIFHQGVRSGSFYGATPLGGMMVLAVGAATGLVLGHRSVTARAVLLALGGVCIVAAVFTNTRASWLAMALLFALVFCCIHKTRTVLVTAAVGLVAFSVALGPMVAQRMQRLEVSKKERSLLERVRYYTAAWRIFAASPVAGLGWGCDFVVRDINLNRRYVAPPPRAWLGKRPSWTRPTVHSAYLQILVRTGALGLLAFLAFLGQWLACVYHAHRARPRSEPDHNLFVAVSASLIGYLCHAGLENFFQWPVMAQAFWLLLGLTTVMAHQLRTAGALQAKAVPTAGGA